MTLPWLKRKMNTGTSVVKMSDGGMTEMSEQKEGLRAACNDLLNAIQSNDSDKMAAAIKAAFDICGSYEESDGVVVE